MNTKRLVLTLWATILGTAILCGQSTLKFTIDKSVWFTVDAGSDQEIIPGDSTIIGGNNAVMGGGGPFRYSWSPSSGLNRSDIANPKASPDTTTTYTLTVQDAEGCTKSSTVTVAVDNVNSLSTVDNVFDLTVHPNPSSGAFHVSSTASVGLGPKIIQVYDPTGRRVYHKVIMSTGQLNTTVRLNNTTSGIYILTLLGDKLSVSRRILVR